MKGYERLKLMVTMVTGLVFDSDGNATATGDDGEDLDPTVGWHLGFYSRPNDGASGVVFKSDGQGNTSFLVAWRDKQFEMSLQKGECGIKAPNQSGGSTLWDENGNIIHTPGGSGTVQLGGNTYSLPKLETLLSDINTLATKLALWVPLVVTAVATAPSGTAVDPGVAAAATAISTAVGAGTYKSTVAKNG